MRQEGIRAARKTMLAVIAAEASVSLPTVSKVLNGRPDVSAETRARIARPRTSRIELSTELIVRESTAAPTEIPL